MYRFRCPGAIHNHEYTSPRYVPPHCNHHIEQHQVGGRGPCGKRTAILVRELEIVETGLAINKGLERKLGVNQGEGLKQERVIVVNRLGRVCITQLSSGR